MKRERLLGKDEQNVSPYRSENRWKKVVFYEKQIFRMKFYEKVIR
jgi:hypothetical protein